MLKNQSYYIIKTLGFSPLFSQITISSNSIVDFGGI